MKKNRIARGQVSARRKDRALKVLDDLLDSPADHVRQKAAAALLASANREEDAEPSDPDAPVVRQITPWNSRPMLRDGKPELARFGITGDPDQRIVTIPPGFDLQNPQPEAFYQPFAAAWWAQYEVRLATRTAARLAIRERHLANGVAEDILVNLTQPSRHDAIFRLDMTPGSTLAERVKAVQARNAAQGIFPQPVEPDGFGGYQLIAAPKSAGNPFGMSDSEYAEVKQFCDDLGMPPAPGEGA